MLTIDFINCSGMFSFGLTGTFQINDLGTIFIRGINEDRNGSSNASGKSSFLNVIKEIGFGKNDTGKSKANVINNHIDWNNGFFGAMGVTDRKGQIWRIFSVRKWKGDEPPGLDAYLLSQFAATGGKYEGTDIFLEKWDPSQNLWIDERPTSIGNKTLEDTQKKIINEIFEMTYEQFSAYVSLGQKAESALIHGTSSSREKIIQAVADISVWDKAAQLVNQEVSIKENQLSILASQINGLQSAIDTFTIPSKEEINELEKTLADLNSKVPIQLIESGSIQDSIKEKNTEITNATAKRNDVQQEVDLLVAEETHTLTRYQLYKDPEEPEEIIKLSKLIDKNNNKITDNTIEIEQYRELGVGECSNCGQVVTAEHLEQEIKKLEDESKRLDSENTKNLIDHKTLFDIFDYDRVSSRKEVDQKYFKEVGLIKKRQEELISDLKDEDVLILELGQLQDKLTIVTNTIESLGVRMTDISSNLESMKNRQSEYEQFKAKLNVEQCKHDDLNITITHYKWVERNLKKLKLQEYDSAIDRLNYFLSEELQTLWGSDMTVRLTTARNKARGSGITQGLDLLIETPNKPSVPIEMYCGGETKSIIVAMFKAMRRLIDERGKAVNIAAIDELDTHLDDYNTDALVDAFSNLADSSSTCFIISHNSRLLNTMQFDDIWTVRKKNDFSTIETQHKIEAVA